MAGILGELFNLAVAPVTSVVGGVIGTAAPLAVSTISAPLAIASEVIAAPLDVLSGVVGGVTGIAGSIAGVGGLAGGAQPGGPVNATGFGGGNGKTATRTIVQTMDLATGEIIRVQMLAGSPKLMNKDVAAARKVARVRASLNKTTPTKTTKVSPMKTLQNSIVQAAIANVSCPPKC